MKLIDKVYEARLTFNESAKFLNLSYQYIYYLTNTNKLPFFVSEKTKYILLADLLEYQHKYNIKKQNNSK